MNRSRKFFHWKRWMFLDPPKFLNPPLCRNNRVTPCISETRVFSISLYFLAEKIIIYWHRRSLAIRIFSSLHGFLDLDLWVTLTPLAFEKINFSLTITTSAGLSINHSTSTTICTPQANMNMRTWNIPFRYPTLLELRIIINFTRRIEKHIA